MNATLAPIPTRFNLVPRLPSPPSGPDLDPKVPRSGVLLSLVRLWQVPSIGQNININGNPYRVQDVGWVLDQDGQRAYVDVEKTRNFDVTMMINGELTTF